MGSAGVGDESELAWVVRKAIQKCQNSNAVNRNKGNLIKVTDPLVSPCPTLLNARGPSFPLLSIKP